MPAFSAPVSPTPSPPCSSFSVPVGSCKSPPRALLCPRTTIQPVFRRPCRCVRITGAPGVAGVTGADTDGGDPTHEARAQLGNPFGSTAPVARGMPSSSSGIGGSMGPSSDGVSKGSRSPVAGGGTAAVRRRGGGSANQLAPRSETSESLVGSGDGNRGGLPSASKPPSK